MTRRLFLVTAAAGMAEAASGSLPEPIRNLRPMTDGIQPITGAERHARVEKARRLLRENGCGALICEGGSSTFYFAGARSEPETGSTLWILPVGGEPVWSPLDRAAQTLRQSSLATGKIAVEERVRFAAVDALRRELPQAEFVSGTPVTAGCRMIKSPAEIALMQRANDITIAAYRAAFAALREGMTQIELANLIAAAYEALGVRGDALVIFGKYTAFPHGSSQPQKLREGDVLLVDDGCSVEGYQSDITRTIIFGKPTARQRQIWELERRAQDAALAAAHPGATCESVDSAARKVITDFGFGPGYRLPGLPHRTGHGIGLDGHEWPYLVRGNQTRLEPGMCFSDEPTIAIEGEFGMRLEDCFYMTEAGPRLFTRQSPAIDQPFASS